MPSGRAARGWPGGPATPSLLPDGLIADLIGGLDLLAVVVGVGAVLLAFFADLQMYRFVARRRPGQAMDQGLWSWSRHPNYFGEFAFWCALGLFGLAAAPHDWWWVLLGAIGMYAMFQGASIPMMEQRSLARRPEYQRVIDGVPRFVPRPPGRRNSLARKESEHPV